MLPSILLADDNSSVRKAIRVYLELSGFRVCGEAVDGLDALEKAAALQPDFIILDLAMPGMNGFDAARKLHEVVPKTHLVIFTLYKDMVNRPEAPEVGIEAVVSKSDGMMALVEKMTSLMGSPQERTPPLT
jgi:two-component system, NarL family, invasion response regulator UvrY